MTPEAARIAITVREPSTDVVAALVARGLHVHRYKLTKRLEALDRPANGGS
jgi:hypothetical protein